MEIENTMTPGAFEYPDEAGYPDGNGVLHEDRTTPVGSTSAASNPPAIDFAVVRYEDGDGSSYRAISGDTMVGEMRIKDAGTRLVIISTTVPPEFRHQGVATLLIRYVLDTVTAENKTVTVYCPIVRAFIGAHPEFSALVDTAHPGAPSAT